MISKEEVERLYRECILIYDKGGAEEVWKFLENKGFPHTGMCLKCEGIRHVDPYDHSCMACGQLAPEMCVVELNQKERRFVQFAINHLVITLEDVNGGIIGDPSFGMNKDEINLLKNKFTS
jgi:hypothetical protein